MSNTCNAIDSGVTLSLYYICLSKAVLLHHITLKAYLNTQPFCLGTFMIMQQDSYTVFLLSDTTASTFFFFFFLLFVLVQLLFNGGVCFIGKLADSNDS